MMINFNLVIEIALAIFIAKFIVGLIEFLIIKTLKVVVKKKYVSIVKVAHMYTEEED